MPTSYTSLIGLALPVTGELAGVWGDTVNNYITQYLDSAVAGTQTISGTQTAVTLSVTNGSSLVTAGSGATGSAQFQIINCTGNPAGLLTITAPASSRQYIIINATSTSQSVKIVGAGPTTGVTLISGEKAHVAWNGSDFVKIATTAAAGGSNTQVQYNSSGVLAGSSNMTFDGTNLTVGGTASATKLIPTGGAATGNGMYLPAANTLAWSNNGSETMRLDSSGNLGLGVTPSAWSGFRALQVGGATSIWSSTSGAGSSFYSNNVYFNGTNRIRLNAGYATEYIQDSSAGAHIWFNAASSTAGSIISFTQAMTLDASGNLAVGTTTADAFGTNYKTVTLQGAGTNTGGVYVSRTSDSSINMYVGTGNSTSFVRTSTNHPLTFWTNDTERARITSGGDLLVGKTDPSYDVNGIALLPTQARFTAANTNPLIILRNGSDGTVADFWRGGTGIVGSISITTTSTAYNTSSDYRLKDNQQPLTGSGAFIDALQPKTWEWKTDGSRGVGFIAHEVQEVSPGSVVGTKDAVDEEGKPVMQAMEYGSAEFIANIVAELQSLRARVAQLESKGA